MQVTASPRLNKINKRLPSSSEMLAVKMTTEELLTLTKEEASLKLTTCLSKARCELRTTPRCKRTKELKRMIELIHLLVLLLLPTAPSIRVNG